jgi:hypothetical protein
LPRLIGTSKEVRRTRGVALPFTLKCILRQKEELWKLKCTSTMQKYNLQKNKSSK